MSTTTKVAGGKQVVFNLADIPKSGGGGLGRGAPLVALMTMVPPYLAAGETLYAHHARAKKDAKGQPLTAKLLEDGRVQFDGKIYNSPSQAAQESLGSKFNGYQFWSVRRPIGEDQEGYFRLEQIRQMAEAQGVEGLRQKRTGSAGFAIEAPAEPSTSEQQEEKVAIPDLGEAQPTKGKASGKK